MAGRTQPLKPGPQYWGPRRARLGISLRVLEEASGVNRGRLSHMEHGLQPTVEEFAQVTAALDRLEAGAATMTAPNAVQEPARNPDSEIRSAARNGTSQPVTGKRTHSDSDTDISPAPSST